jgi:hypothetical protein
MIRLYCLKITEGGVTVVLPKTTDRLPTLENLRVKSLTNYNFIDICICREGHWFHNSLDRHRFAIGDLA